MPYYNFNLISSKDIILSGDNPYTFSWCGTDTIVSVDGDKIYYNTNGRQFNNLDKRILGMMADIIPKTSYIISPPDITFYIGRSYSTPYSITKQDNTYIFNSIDDTHIIKVEYETTEDIRIAKLNIIKKYNFSKNHNEIMETYVSIISEIECDCLYIIGKHNGKILDDYYDGISYSWKSKKYHRPTNKIISKICSGMSFPKLRPLP